MEKVGIVLSGGGARGSYQIGVWKALNKLKIKYDVVTGTSVGALNGLLFVQKDYKKAYKIWKNIGYDFLFDDAEKLNITTEHIYKTYISEFFKHGGMEVKQLEKQIEIAYDEKKFYSSPVDYGIVVYNLTKLKPEMLTKNMLTNENIKDYVLASASCFPTFKMKNIEGMNYIDGGYYDNMPINLCATLGATKIIAVDMKAIGIKRKTKNKNLDITIITPNNKITPTFVFDSDLAVKTMKFGYNDTMKVFGKYVGKKFTYKKKSFEKYKNKKTSKNNIDKILSYYPLKHQKTIYELLVSSQLLDIIEYLGTIFSIEESKIYSIKKFNKLLIKKLNETQTKEFNIKDKFKTKKNIQNKEYVKYITQSIYNQDEKVIKKSINETPKEFISALYLYTIL